MATKLILPAYRRNIRKACANEGKRVPKGYTTDIAPNGDFIVRSNGDIVGRIKKGEYEIFTKTN